MIRVGDTEPRFQRVSMMPYALLTGHPPFAGFTAPQLIAKIRNETPEPPRKAQMSINDHVEAVVLRMLAKRPDDRYETPAALLKELERIGTELERIGTLANVTA